MSDSSLIPRDSIFSRHCRLVGQVAPFDLVFEYNHAVEGWQAFSRPTISRLGEMVHTIGDFMREMSQLVQKEYARYAHQL